MQPTTTEKVVITLAAEMLRPGMKLANGMGRVKHADIVTGKRVFVSRKHGKGAVYYALGERVPVEATKHTLKK